MEYGKIENNMLVHPPKKIVINDKLIINPSEDKLLYLGYLPVEKEEFPNLQDDEIVKNVYEIIDNKIHVSYIVEKIEQNIETYNI